MGEQVYGAIKVKAEGQQELSAYSMVTGNINLMNGLENGCHWPGMAVWLEPHKFVIVPSKATLKAC